MMITESFKSLTWAFILMALIIYVFAICFTQSATEHLNQIEAGGETDYDFKLRDYFGGMSSSVDNLIQAMLGGMSWGEYCGPMGQAGWAALALFYFYIFFTMFAVLNIVTGVFVDSALQATQGQRDMLA
jgi:hypothetical protein